VNELTETYGNMNKIVKSYRAWVKSMRHYTDPTAFKQAEEIIESLIALAAANGMDKEELDELAGVWYK